MLLISTRRGPYQPAVAPVRREVGRVVPCVMCCRDWTKHESPASPAAPVHVGVRSRHNDKIHSHHSTHPGTQQPRTMPTHDGGVRGVKSQEPDRPQVLLFCLGLRSNGPRGVETVRKQIFPADTNHPEWPFQPPAGPSTRLGVRVGDEQMGRSEGKGKGQGWASAGGEGLGRRRLTLAT